VGYVHCDLAGRNVLVSADLLDIKIAGTHNASRNPIHPSRPSTLTTTLTITLIA
jgi:hypothetical protein